MKNLIMTFLTAGIQLLVFVGLTYLINFLKTKTTTTENLQRYYDLIKKIVQAVEQVYGSGTGTQKKAEAVKTIQKIVGNKLTMEEIDNLIESAVFEMNQVLKSSNIAK
jgi:LL-H family phage holin